MSDFQGLRVMVVDDNRHQRMLARQILSALGAEIDDFASPQEALERFRVIQPDVVLVDFEMPGMSGAALTAALRAAETGGERTAILLMTAHSDARRVTEAAKAGVDGVVAKPLSTALLLQRIVQARARALAAAQGGAPPNHRRVGPHA